MLPMSDEDDTNTAVVSKLHHDIVRRGLHIRITEQHHDKLNMIVRETSRSKREVIEMLIDMSQVGKYSE